MERVDDHGRAFRGNFKLRDKCSGVTNRFPRRRIN